MVDSKRSWKAWIYLSPAILLLLVFTVWPIINTIRMSLLEGYSSMGAAGGITYSFGIGNFKQVLEYKDFMKCLGNTMLLCVLTVPISTFLALLIAVCLNAIKPLQRLLQTIFFLPYVTNTLAVGMVFMILFQKTEYTDGLVNIIMSAFGMAPVDFIEGPYWARMLVLSIYTVWMVMPFKILVLTSALASVKQDYYNAAAIDGATGKTVFFRITLPQISPMLFYLIITGFIGAFKAYGDAVAIFGEDLNAKGMNTLVGYIYDMLYGDGGGFPSYASAAAIILFVIILTVTCINLTVSKKQSVV